MKPITGKTYDRLKFLAQILLPAVGTLYLTLGGIWGLPSTKEVVGTIVAIDTFLGVLLQLSSSAYQASDARFDGAVHVGEQNADGTQNFKIEVPLEASDYAGAKQIVLKVNQPDSGGSRA